MENTAAPHVAILPSPGMGHLIPVIEFAKRLVENHHFSVTLIISTTGPPSKAQHSILESLPISINSVILPPVSFNDLPENASPIKQVMLSMTLCLSHIRETVKALVAKTSLAALIIDLFGTSVFEVAKEFHIPSFMFFTSNAMCLSFAYMLPFLDEEVSCEFKDLSEPVQIPGCVPVVGRDLMDPIQDRSGDLYKLFLNNSKQFLLADGILINSFMELEEGVIKDLQEEKHGRPPLYPIGPLIKTGSNDEEIDPSGCLKWLDCQARGSVVYVSFGSGGTLSHEQLTELAFGLERSGQNFLWAVRSPNNHSSDAAFFSVQSQNDPFGYLPTGFSERTKDRGLVVSSWVPQTKVLDHRSTGGFLSHCGWNSILESVVHGVPMIAWPLYAEQKMNAVHITEGLRIAVRPKISENGLVVRAEIAKVVKNLIEGEEGKLVRKEMMRLEDAATKVLSKDGSSTESLAKFAKIVTQSNPNPSFVRQSNWVN